jgi:hypothetical protein
MPSTLARSSTPARCRRRARRQSAAAGAPACAGPRRGCLPAGCPGAHAGTARAHAGDGKAVRLVADLRHQHQGRRVVPEPHLGAAVGEHQFLQTDLAALALLDADDQAEVQAQFLEHLARHRHLAAPAVDQHQVGQARTARLRAAALAGAGPRPVPGGDSGGDSATGPRHRLGAPAATASASGIAARQHLAHRGVVVAAGDAFDVEAAVLRCSASGAGRRPRTMPASLRPRCG